MLSGEVYRLLSALVADVNSAIDRVQANAAIEEVELRVATARNGLELLRTTIGAPSGGSFEDASRHLRFLAFYHAKGHPDGYASDVANLRDRDLPGVIQAAEEWTATVLDPGLVDAIRGAWDGKQYDSAVRDAFVYLEAVLRLTGDINPSAGLSGVRLADAAFGPKSAVAAQESYGFLGAATDGEREGGLELMRGAFRLFRNASAHRRIPYTAAQADDVIHLVNLCLHLLPPASG